jgi:hypothetical protein
VLLKSAMNSGETAASGEEIRQPGSVSDGEKRRGARGGVGV